jgi:ketosteroid isomerase-like protein
MKRRFCHAALLFALLTFVVVLPAGGAVPAGPDEAAIDKVRLAFNASYNAGDVKALARLLDRDAVWMPPTGEGAIAGADKIAARYTAFFEKTRSVFDLKAE